MKNLRSNKIFLLSGLVIFSVIVIFVVQLSGLYRLPTNTDTNHDFKINNGSYAKDTELSQVITKKIDPLATPETNIELIATSNERYILEICAKNSSTHYDSLDVLRGDNLITHLDLMNNTHYICTTNSSGGGEETDITTSNVSGFTKLIVTLRTYDNATASIDYPR